MTILIVYLLFCQPYSLLYLRIRNRKYIKGSYSEPYFIFRYKLAPWGPLPTFSIRPVFSNLFEIIHPTVAGFMFGSCFCAALFISPLVKIWQRELKASSASITIYIFVFPIFIFTFLNIRKEQMYKKSSYMATFEWEVSLYGIFFSISFAI